MIARWREEDILEVFLAQVSSHSKCIERKMAAGLELYQYSYIHMVDRVDLDCQARQNDDLSLMWAELN